MKTLRIFELTVIAILLSVITSCSKDDETTSKLLGYWYGGGYGEVLYFGENGKGTLDSKDIKWSYTESTLTIDRLDWGIKTIHLYQVTEDELVLIDMNDGYTTSYSRSK